MDLYFQSAGEALDILVVSMGEELDGNADEEKRSPLLTEKNKTVAHK